MYILHQDHIKYCMVRLYLHFLSYHENKSLPEAVCILQHSKMQLTKMYYTVPQMPAGP